MTGDRTILVTTVDVSSGADDEFHRWYTAVHLPEIMACPGFLSAERYECLDGQPRYMAVYELESADALSTTEMKRVRGWGEMFPYVRNFHERVYSRIFAFADQQVE